MQDEQEEMVVEDEDEGGGGGRGRLLSSGGGKGLYEGGRDVKTGYCVRKEGRKGGRKEEGGGKEGPLKKE